MRALFVFLIHVILYSFLLLSNPKNLTKARNLSPDTSFKTDLIHRNSLMTPQEIELRATFGSVSFGRNIKLSSTYFDQNNVNTNVIPNGGDYLMKISIGTPPLELTAVVDTGSNLIWVQCSPCQRCIQPESHLFDPTKSSTNHIIPCNAKSCNYQDFECGCIPLNNNNVNNNINNNTESCVYLIQYGDGTESIGVLSTETISFASSDSTLTSFPSTIFGCGYDQQGYFGPQGDGIVGLGLGLSSLPSQLGPLINYKFSYCLTPLSSNVPGKLTFGSDLTRPGVVSTPFTTQDPPVFYTLTLNSVSIGNNSVDIGGQEIIIDSGTTLTFVPTNVYDTIKTTMKSSIGLSPVPDPDQVFDPCYEAQPTSEGFNPPDVVFHFEGADVVLKAINTFRTVKNLTCLAILPSDDSSTFGNIAQIDFEVGYDLKANQISFAPTDCSKY